MSDAGVPENGNHLLQVQTAASRSGQNGYNLATGRIRTSGHRSLRTAYASTTRIRERNSALRGGEMPVPGSRSSSDLPSDTVSSHPGTRGALALADLERLEKSDTQPLPSRYPIALRRHILIVDDDSRMARVITAALELEGEPDWAVEAAGLGAHALELAVATPPDLVLLDVRLPDLDGAQVYQRLRANPGTKSARILFLSAGTSFDLFKLGIEDGVLLRKPFPIPELVGLVRTLLCFRNSAR